MVDKSAGNELRLLCSVNLSIKCITLSLYINLSLTFAVLLSLLCSLSLCSHSLCSLSLCSLSLCSLSLCSHSLCSHSFCSHSLCSHSLCSHSFCLHSFCSHSLCSQVLAVLSRNTLCLFCFLSFCSLSPSIYLALSLSLSFSFLSLFSLATWPLQQYPLSLPALVALLILRALVQRVARCYFSILYSCPHRLMCV